MALAKSVSKLLSAASASKGRLIVITCYFMFAVELTSGFELLRGSHWWFSRPLVQGMNLNKVMYVQFIFPIYATSGWRL